MIRPGFLLAGLCLLLSACATQPSQPLLSPVEKTGDYGYRDHRLGPASYKITYRGPQYRLPAETALRRVYADAAIAQAADLALWRAAQLTLADGFAAFVVVRRSTDIDIVADPGGYVGPYRHPFDDPFHPLSPYYFRHVPLAPFRYDRVPPTAFGRAQATVAIRMVRTADAEARDAKSLIETLRARLGTEPMPALPRP